MLAPQLQRCPLLGGIGAAFVDTGNASLVAADVIQRRFDDVRLNSEISHPGSRCATQVVQLSGPYQRIHSQC